MKARAKSGAVEGSWLRAEKQNGGVGRMGRRWESPKGNLYCSTIVNCRIGDPAPLTLSFVAALAVYETINAHLPHDEIWLKWPNDILVSGSKICGILLEGAGDSVVVGIGVNVAIAPEVEGRVVTSLHKEGADPELTASAFLESLAQNFMDVLIRWRQSGLAAILDVWQQNAHPVGTRLSTSDAHGIRVDGEYAGLSNDGALRLRKPDGTLIEIHAGDVEVG
ncbi:biotin--[acetyl-CoA-carboxylase] ligase [Parasphingorhabdus litoris]|uniref:biotin--[biotin carboxyl-carrier protein] ligase n=2 Tax=Parasphingorhabdus litoris TaxID=394733 RepID=A0ABN1APF6_9SPHN|nr:biotin--[acetyl-CoA-carboxylase] ligase [Parasphingorhabdus litoris]